MRNYTCEQRKVLDDGRIVCSKIKLGDLEVSPSVCRACPARSCNCQHLRFSLQKRPLRPIVVRWGNGHTKIWDDHPVVLSFVRSACAVTTVPISSASDCSGCALRTPSLPQEEMQAAVGHALTAVPERALPLAGA
jgi:hypothetical protein